MLAAATGNVTSQEAGQSVRPAVSKESHCEINALGAAKASQRGNDSIIASEISESLRNIGDHGLGSTPSFGAVLLDSKPFGPRYWRHDPGRTVQAHARYSQARLENLRPTDRVLHILRVLPPHDCHGRIYRAVANRSQISTPVVAYYLK